MNKIIVSLCISTLLTFNATAAEQTAYSLPKAEEIIKKCENKNTAADNDCLKAEIIKIISETFDDDEKNYLVEQMEQIQKSVEKADLNLNNEQIKQFANNKETEKELRLRSLNEIWQKLLKDTVRMMSDTGLEV